MKKKPASIVLFDGNIIYRGEIDQESLERDLRNIADGYYQMFKLHDKLYDKDVYINPKYVAYIDVQEVKENE